MDKTELQLKQDIKRYLEELLKLGIKARRVILYGSFAKGMPRRDSDIDLLVISDDFAGMNLRQRLEVLGVAAARILKPIEAYGCTEADLRNLSEASFLKEILTSGITIG
jgi:hypothetical protein